MRPALTILLVTGCLAAVLAAPASAAPFAAGVRVLDCRHGPESTDRQVTFRAAARRIAGASRMWIRLRLEERTPRTAWKAVAAPGLGVWRKSRPGVGRFAIRQRVLALAEGSSYRVLARVRWYAANGKVLRRARRRSGACRQGDDLPNLRVRWIAAGVPLAGAVRYRVEVANPGRASAPPSSVRLAVDGDVADNVAVPELAPRQTVVVQATGPRCAFSMIANADPADVVRESDELDNGFGLSCGSL